MTTMVRQEVQSQVAHFCRLLDHLGLIEPKYLYQLSQLEVFSALSPKEIERERFLRSAAKV